MCTESSTGAVPAPSAPCFTWEGMGCRDTILTSSVICPPNVTHVPVEERGCTRGECSPHGEHGEHSECGECGEHRLPLPPAPSSHPGSRGSALACSDHSCPRRVQHGAPSITRSLPIMSEEEKGKEPDKFWAASQDRRGARGKPFPSLRTAAPAAGMAPRGC